jgi:hypothetical protein
MDSDELFAKLLDQIRDEVRDEIEESIRKETLDAILEYFTEDEGWDADAEEYRKEVAEHVRDAFDRNF